MTINNKHIFEGHTGPIYSLEEGVKTGTIFSAGSDGFVATWNFEELQPEKFSIKFNSPIYKIKIIKELNLLLVGQSNGVLNIIDFEHRVALKHLQLHVGGIFSIDFSLQHKYIFTVGADGKLTVLDINNYEIKLALSLSDKKIRCVKYFNNQVFYTTSYGELIVLDVQFFNEIKKNKIHGDACNTIYINDNIIYTGGKDAHFSMLNMNSLDVIKKIPAHNFAIYAICRIKDTPYLVTASRDKTIKIWDNNLQIVKRIESKSRSHTRSINGLLSITPQQFFSAGDDGKINFWELTSI